MSCKAKDGGYCPKCDTVWASPGKCRCVTVMPLTDREAEVANIRYIEGWNAAIEAAYHIVIKASESPEGIKVAEEVRKLKND